MSCRWLPNAISLTRVVLSPGLVLLALLDCWRAAFFLFIALLLSDCLDGYLAIKLNARSRLGKFIDPVGDSMLSAGSILGLVLTGNIPLAIFTAMSLLFILICAGLFFLPETNRMRLVCNSLSPLYYIAALGLFTGLYAYRAFNQDAVYLSLPAAFFLYFLIRINRHRLKGLVNGHWH